MAYRFLLDADISYEVARIGRALGLDVISVSECGRAELRDDEQLALAASDERIFVTRNRNDFIRWTVEFAHALRPHAGVLIVPRSIEAVRPNVLAQALVEWERQIVTRLGAGPLASYFIDFI